MFKESTKQIADKLGDQLNSLKKEFHGITVDVRVRLRDLIMMMLKLDGTVKSENGDTPIVTWTASGSKQEVQKATQQVILEWAARWCIGNDTDFSTIAMDVAIPEVYYGEVEEVDDSETDDIDDEGYNEFLAREAEDGFLR
jgi:hypothetical protein